MTVSIGTAIAVLFAAGQSLTTHAFGYHIVVETCQVLHYCDMQAGIMAKGLPGMLLHTLVLCLETAVHPPPILR